MSTNKRQPAVSDSQLRSRHAIANVSHSPWSFLDRHLILILCTIVGAIAGTIWYENAPRKFESSSDFMVSITNGKELDGETSSTKRTIPELLPIYEKAVTSDQVMNRVAARLQNEFRVNFKEATQVDWINDLRSKLTVSSNPENHIISVRYVADDAESGELIVATIIESFIAEMREVRESELKEKLNLARSEKSQINLLSQSLERDIAAMKRTTSVLLRGEATDQSVVVQQLGKLDAALIEAQKRTLESRALLVSVQSAVTTGSNLQSLAQQLSTDLTLRETAAGTIRTRREADGSSNRVASAAMKPSRDLELGRKLLDIAKQRLRQAGAHEDTLREVIESVRFEAANLKRQLAQVEAAERAWYGIRGNYDIMLNTLTKYDLDADSGMNFSVTSPAKLNLDPVSPRISETVILCLFFGIIAGIILKSLREFLAGRFRLAAVLQKRLGLPLLAEINKLERLPGSGLDAIVTFTNEGGPDSKPFRNLRSALTFSVKKSHRLLVTSTEKGDGKTTTITNLAVAFAQANKKTLLIDADIHQAGTTKLFDLQGSRGLSQILRDDKPIAESCLENIFNLGFENLDVMPAGRLPENLKELLSSNRLSEIIDWATSIYDQVLFDVPPILKSPDIGCFSRLVDGAIVVVRPDKNRRKSVVRAIKACRDSGIEVVGFVANQTTLKPRTEPNQRRSKIPEINIENPSATEEQRPRLVA